MNYKGFPLLIINEPINYKFIQIVNFLLVHLVIWFA